MDIKGFDIEGSVDEIAEQLFKKMIGPIFDHLAKTDPELAVEFGYCIAGNGIACYMNSLNDVSKAEKLIIESTQSMAADIKRHRNKVC
ncbi:hypothetical protein [Acinetobacter bereziniae]|uniref:hypothetical protein n=1 Tax=Acinetobacter bereziniae TaxID=106648 RepID=UPI001116D461|nr:hypothetical protein [Acinetobacter bereziniae]TNL46610.1 hypothetical protein EYB59_16690 [Acinetobacter bereziniae]TNL56741.1 hypothetical protein EYY58_14610 [Acinetobacter bereziniae]